MNNIIDKIKANLVIQEQWDKNSFWASDCEKDQFELYHRFKGTEITNPPKAETQIIFTTGKLVELAIVERLEEMNLIEPPFFKEDKKDDELQTRIDIVRCGIKVSGKLDAMVRDNGEVVVFEIKSFYGVMQANELRNGNPRVTYLKQLAIYMDALDKERGILFYIDRGTGEMFQFTLEHIEGYIYSCTSFDKNGFEVITQFDLLKDYERFGTIYNQYVAKDIEPDSSFRYKVPLDKIDWRSLPASKIGKARNNQAVIGDWQVLYSPFKDMIVTKEAKEYGKTMKEYLGYDSKDLAIIAEATKGYTTWKKK